MDDAYMTPPWAVQAILPHLWHPTTVLEPSCGDGAILRACRDAWPLATIHGTDIRPEAVASVEAAGFRATALDFLDAIPARFEEPALVITNPPYSYALDFCRYALEVVDQRCGQVAMLLRLAFIASQKRAPFHRRFPSDVYVLPRRPSFTGGPTDSADYAWFVWSVLGGKCEPAAVGRPPRVQILEV
jgi:hypothetical protein